jgi:hypothetical protein
MPTEILVIKTQLTVECQSYRRVFTSSSPPRFPSPRAANTTGKATTPFHALRNYFLYRAPILQRGTQAHWSQDSSDEKMASLTTSPRFILYYFPAPDLVVLDRRHGPHPNISRLLQETQAETISPGHFHKTLR